MKVAFFTGHRTVTSYHKANINKLIDYALDQGCNYFLSGMALGTDTIAAQLLSERGLPWTAVIPFKGQEQRWQEVQKLEYKRLLALANKVIIIEPAYSKGVYEMRNDYMIRYSHLCLAVYAGKNGGTRNAVRKVVKRGMSLIVYCPITRQFHHR
ncbi:SLOG family protein (plasmid) [Synechocystis sp. B12]|nr:SLOG family protein [Synechocystis sp. B12]